MPPELLSTAAQGLVGAHPCFDMVTYITVVTAEMHMCDM
jgi:hypothetical protein